MITLTSHCGIYRFSFANSNEKSLLEIMLNNEINTEGLIVSAPIITYSVKGRMIGDNVFTINYEGTTGKVLEMNGLTYNIFTKKVIEIKNLNNNPISSDIQ